MGGPIDNTGLERQTLTPIFFHTSNIILSNCFVKSFQEDDLDLVPASRGYLSHVFWNLLDGPISPELPSGSVSNGFPALISWEEGFKLKCVESAGLLNSGSIEILPNLPVKSEIS